MFIQTESTPNPATLKFLPGGPVLGDGSREIQNEEEARVSPLAGALFAIDGVSGVFLGPDFISVTKSFGEWQHLKPAILGAIMEHFMSGGPILSPGEGNTDLVNPNFSPRKMRRLSRPSRICSRPGCAPRLPATGATLSFADLRMASFTCK